MGTIRQIQDRVVLVDFYPASHGHFLIDTLHSLLYPELKSIYNFGKNFHKSDLVPPGLYLQTKSDINKKFLDYEFEETVTMQRMLDLSDNRPMLWPCHFSAFWIEQRNSGVILPNLTQHIGTIPIIEIYVTPDIGLRHCINVWFNMGPTYSHTQLSDNEFFTNNFYNYCKQINKLGIFNNQVAKSITTTPEKHVFSQSEVLRILETDIYQPQKYRTLRQIPLSNRVFSMSMNIFYDFEMFKTTIQDIKKFFNLDYEIDNYDLMLRWNKLMSIQKPINVYNSAMADSELTLVEQAYRNKSRLWK
jgi:hypothetical protein